jgi:glycosyltransferase involved in cell wall biosynthesis
MKSILFLSSWYPSRVHATLGNFVNYHANSVGFKNKVNVLYIVPDDHINDYELDHYKSGNVTTTIVYFKRGIFKYYNYWKAFQKGFTFLIKYKKLKFDIIHMNIMFPAVWQAIFLKWRLQIPFIASENWHGFQDLSRYNISSLKKLMLKIAFKSAHTICPVSKQLKDGMENGGFKANYKVIPNVVNTDLFKINSKKNSQFTFLHVSTLDDSIKNVTGIIKGFEELKNSTCKLKIVGDGETDWIHQLVKESKLEDQILIEGEKTYEEIAVEMQMANAFVLFSNIENLPLVLIEAMATGIPFIATKVGGIPELFKDNLGLLIEKGDIKALIYSMNYIVDNYANYNPTEIRDYAVNNYSYQKVGDQFNELYNEILKNN